MLIWFYCLPVVDAILLVVFASLIFLMCKKQWEKMRVWSWTTSGLIVLWLLAIFYVTLGNRDADLQTSVHMIPLYSYYVTFKGNDPEILRSCFMNIILFYPVGLLAGAVYLQRWKIEKRILLLAVIGGCMSILIEVIQYSWQLGLAEVDDVIHNTLGTVIGAWIGSLRLQNVFKPKREHE